MDRSRFSRIAHADHGLMSPIGTAKLEAMLARIELSPGDRVLDVGCGKAEVAVRLAARGGVRALAIDRDEELLREAEARSRGRVPPERLELRAGDAKALVASLAPASFAAAVCVGASHALGGWVAMLETLRGLVKPGGAILAGEAYWKRPPAPAYLAGLGGAREDDASSHAENVSRAEHLGLVPIHAVTASDDEWDDHEWRYSSAVESFVRDHPSDPDAAELRERIRAWRTLYLRHGRETLGFGLYLFRNG